MISPRLHMPTLFMCPSPLDLYFRFPVTLLIGCGADTCTEWINQKPSSSPRPQHHRLVPCGAGIQSLSRGVHGQRARWGREGRCLESPSTRRKGLKASWDHRGQPSVLASPVSPSFELLGSFFLEYVKYKGCHFDIQQSLPHLH